ncbi:DUF3558 domain-containing protein [Saccharothrix violaceirubra]|uniref:DUF3558 domain-containing protein n=1 Tax=Saccharothrix violaceirubra TaxID=413306 RepID=A0A7W7TAG0_9PSEU|nr:DUF3558 domain-containing protein [Saccharothrix violaceirubra]MBB4969503.1 hypothetical protein [Saccharothrix violaceirubra]
MRAVALLGAATVTGACGTAEPTRGVTLPISQTFTTKAGSDRPTTVKVDGVDPCRLLTPGQMKQLKVVENERNDSDVVGAGNVPTCEFTGDLQTNYGVSVITGTGVEYWTGKGNTDVGEVVVGGFPARTISLSGTAADCAVAVDVADKQQLYVDFIPIGSGKPTKDVMCQNAAKGAELALATLQTLK